MKLLLIVFCLIFGVYSFPAEDGGALESLLSVKVVHVTNPEEFLKDSGNKTPLGLRVNGPFVYNVKVEKSNVRQSSDGSVTFDSKKVYTFNPDLSIAQDDQALFSVPNVPYFNLINSNQDPKIIAELIAESGSQPFVLKHVQELLWGYEDPLLQLMQDRGLSKSNKYGLFMDDPELSGQTLTVSSSETVGVDTYSKVESINGKAGGSVWGTEKCDRVKGTTDFMDADVRVGAPTLQDPSKSLYFLSSRICRPFKFSFKSNETNEEGEAYLRYEADDEFFGSTKKYPDNVCFCPTADKCPLQGTADISKCKSGIILSWPYFNFADPTIPKSYDQEFQPREHDHDEFVEVDSGNGKIKSFKLDLQWNVRMKKNPGVPRTQNFTDILIPLIQTSDMIQMPISEKGSGEDDLQELDTSVAGEAMKLESKDVVKKVVKQLVKGKTKKHKKSSGSALSSKWFVMSVFLPIAAAARVMF